MIGPLAAERPMIPPTRLSYVVGKTMKRQKGQGKKCALCTVPIFNNLCGSLAMCIKANILGFYTLQFFLPGREIYLSCMF